MDNVNDIDKLNGYIESKINLINNFLNLDMIVRHHTDADGISSALIFRYIIRKINKNRERNGIEKIHVRFVAQRFAKYTQHQMEMDISDMYPRDKHGLVLLDIGSGEGTELTINQIKELGIKTMCIDHHPSSYTDVFDIGINPWWILKIKNPSKYTAGYLTGLLAKKLGLNGKIIDLLMDISLFGDTSEIRNKDDKNAEKLSIIIDIQTAKRNYNLDYYERLVNDNKMIIEEWANAKELIDSVLEISKKHKNIYTTVCKSDESNTVQIFTVDLDPIYEGTGFSARGKMLDMVFLEENKEDNTIGIGYTNTGVMFRIGTKVPKELLADKIIEFLKKERPDLITSGGGHPHASSIQIKKGYVNGIIKLILKYVNGNGNQNKDL